MTYCYDVCPAESKFAQESDRTCRASCDNFYYINSESTQQLYCVDTCTIFKKLDNGKECLRADGSWAQTCPDKQYFDTVMGCVDACETHSYNEVTKPGNVIVKECTNTCSKYIPVGSEKKCVKACPEG